MGNFGSSLLTFLLSVPLTAIALMAIFGVPHVSQLAAAPNGEIVVRDPFQDAWSKQTPMSDAPAYGANANASARSWNQPPEWSDPPQNPDFTTSQTGDINQSSGSQLLPGTGDPRAQIGNVSPRQGAAPADYSEQPVRQNPFQPQQQPQPRRNPFDQSLQHTQGSVADLPQNSLASVDVNDPRVLLPNEIPKSSDPRGSMGPRGEETAKQLLSWDQAQRRMSELGIKKYQITNGTQPGQFLVVCYFSPPTTAQITHRFDAEGNNPQAAVTEVIAKIEEWIAKDFAANAYAGAGGRL